MGAMYRMIIVQFFCGRFIGSGLNFPLPKQPDETVPFRFNCGEQLCSFPIQFCDIDEKRCLFCSDDSCKAENFHEQCHSYCSRLLNVNQNISDSKDKSNLTQISQNMESNNSGGVMTVLWLILGVLVVILFLIIILIVCACRMKKFRNSPFIANPADEESQCFGTDESTSSESSHQNYVKLPLLKEKPNTKHAAVSTEDRTSMNHTEQSSTNSDSLLAQPEISGESRQHEHYFEPNLLKNSYEEKLQESTADHDSGFVDGRQGKIVESSLNCGNYPIFKEAESDKECTSLKASS